MLHGLVVLVVGILGCMAVRAAEGAAVFPQRMHVKDGVLYYEDRSEVALWGVNFQPCLSWEYRSRMKRAGVPLEIEALKKTTDASLDELAKMGCDVVRTHLTPADFTDADGNLVDTIFLDALDYMIARARKKNVYVYLTLLNHMGGGFVKDSFIASEKEDRAKWITDAGIVAKSRNYIKHLIEHENRYTGIRLKDDPVIAVLELINEPHYIEEKKDRGAIVRQYIDGMCDWIRGLGAQQPIVWNCNWARMIRGREDVFQAIAASKADAVSFCLYPGQDQTKAPFWDNPVDLSKTNFLPYIAKVYEQRDWLGWLKEDRFKSKAKLVYEFETFYNYSTYGYPAMARVFRALGVQIAPMWTYCLDNYAPYASGSHNLNLKCTPRKAASFIVAGEIFRGTKRLTPYKTSAADEDVFGPYALSFTRDLSIAAPPGTYLYTGDVTWEPVKPSGEVNRIAGYGSSPLVNYPGTGLYFITIDGNEMHLEIMPHATHTQPLWQLNKDGKVVTVLDHTTPKAMQIKLSSWAGAKVFRVDGDQRIPVATKPGALQFEATPGRYLIRRER